MRIVPLVAALVVSAVLPLRAQAPAPDAPMARHVAYLLEQARDGFARLRDPGTFNTSAPLFSTVAASRHPMRFQGADVVSELRLNPNWNVMHVSLIPVAGTKATADSVLARLSTEIAAVVPAGWRKVGGASGIAGWVECGFAGRELSMQTSLPSQSPAITLIVYKFDKPCEAQTSGG